MKRWYSLAALVTGLALLAGIGATARVADAAPSANAPIKVGIVYSRTGAFAAYGAEYLSGLRLGLDYATGGKGTVNGRKIEFTLVDDGTDAAKAVSGAKDLIGQGYKILAGSESSGAALAVAPLADQNKVLFISGPAATDAVSGINKYTFRSGRQTYQDVKASTAYLKGAIGKNVVVFAQDIAFGQGNVAAVRSIFGDLSGQKVDSVLVPASAQDFTPYAQRLKQKNPDLVYRRVGWVERGGDVERARPAGRLRHGRHRRHGPLGAGDVVVVRPGAREAQVPQPLHRRRAEERRQRLAHEEDGAARPGAGSLHSGRVRRGSDDRPRAFEGVDDRRLEDDLCSRGLELHGPEGPAGDPLLRSRDAAADVPRPAEAERRQLTANTLVRLRAKNTAPPEKK